jgi:hypothetical protein
MAKPLMKPEFEQLKADLTETMIAGLHEWRADLSYPQSHSDLQACLMAVFRMFEIKRRPIALELKDLLPPKETP